jgi:hypothetical protein
MIVINRLCFIIENILVDKLAFSKKGYKISKVAKILNITKCRENELTMRSSYW